MISGLVSGLIGSSSGSSGASGTAAALPTLTSETAAQIMSGGQFNGGTAKMSLPAGDWAVGGWINLPTGVTTSSGAILASGAYTATTQMFQIFYNNTTGRISAYGYDSAGEKLGSWTTRYSGSHYASIGDTAIEKDTPTFLCLVKTGNLLRLYQTPRGHAARLVAEHYTTFGALNITNSLYFGSDSSSSTTQMQFAKWFKLSYALTAAQITAVMNGTDPTTLGTPAATDWYFLFPNANATQTSTINSLTSTRLGSTGYSSVAGFWYAAQTEGVFPDVLGLGEGHVFQEANGLASVTISGIYVGTAGADIQAQLIDHNGACFSGWKTIAKGATGGVFTGVLDVPKKKRWVRVQLRKIINDVVSTQVMTSTYRFGVGMVVALGGQSVMVHQSFTTLPYGTALRTPNGFWSNVSQTQITVGGVGYDRIAVSGTANNGGLIQINHATPHGLKTGDRIYPITIGGTIEANNQYWFVTVVDRLSYTLQGSTYANAYTSGGFVYVNRATVSVPVLGTAADASVILAETLGNKYDCVVALANVAVGGTPIEFFNSDQLDGTHGAVAGLVLHRVGKVGAYLWMHGHANMGQTSYFSDGGSEGAWTGWGELGKLLDWNRAKFPNDNFLFGIAGFTAVAGMPNGTGASFQTFRWGMEDWVNRKIAGGDTKCFFICDLITEQPMSENGTMGPNGHMHPIFKASFSIAARLGFGLAQKLAGRSGFGPALASATRSGNVIMLTVTHNTGSALQTMASGAKLSGFEVATDTAFASKLTITDAQITGANTLALTLSADPGATVYVRYMWGQPGNYASGAYMTPRISGVADNGAGLIRVTMGSGVTGQKTGGHGLTTGAWVTINAAKDSNGSSPANGTWQVINVDTQNIDLVGSSSAALGTFSVGSTLYGSGEYPVVQVELGAPVYDTVVVGGFDVLGLPLRPTYTYLTAA